MSKTRKSLGAIVGAAALVAVSATAAQAAPAQRALEGSVPSWANAAHSAGSVNGKDQVTFRVYLDFADPAGAAAYATAVSTKGSPEFEKFLTPAQFVAKFAPAQSSVDAVSSWLKAQGFRVGQVPANRKYVEATGTLDQAAAAFGTSFAQFTVEGRSVRGNTKSLNVPASLPMVEGVVGLDESQTLIRANKVVAPSAGFRNAQPCSAYWGEKTVSNTPTPDGTKLPASPDAFAPCGYAGAQLQGAYGMTSAIAATEGGAGVTVGVIDAFASPYIVQDTNTYFSKHGLPQWKPGQFTQEVPPGVYQRATNKKQDPQGWAGEETLDIEAVHTMAPGANVVYYGAPTNGRDMDALMNRVVMDNKVDIVTNSYGYGGEALPKGTIKPSLDTQIQAAAQGITLFFSSGDDADETGGDPNVAPTPDWPASSPYVTAVGGTSLGVTQDNKRLFELGWETAKSSLASGVWSTPAYLYGSGGGTSRLFAQPSYQAGVVPNALATRYGGAPMRVVPDVAAVGDPTTGMLVGQTQSWSDGSTSYDEYRIGGTSLASPIYAGIFALVVKEAQHRYGLANPALYAARGASYDITKDDLATYPGAVRADFVNSENANDGYRYTARWFDRDEPLTIHVRPGYDDVTGVGSPDGAGWFSSVVAYKKA